MFEIKNFKQGCILSKCELLYFYDKNQIQTKREKYTVICYLITNTSLPVYLKSTVMQIVFETLKVGDTN